jgi:hypothetical protein
MRNQVKDVFSFRAAIRLPQDGNDDNGAHA